MKRIFLIGDSIRVGYDSHVRALLEDRAQLYWPNDNARFAHYTLRYAQDWACQDCDPERIDVVHWNNGLWDVLHLMDDETPQTPPDEYRRCLTRIARRLKRIFPNARIVFALTTSVVEERMAPHFHRYNAEIEAYNAAAREVMAQEGIAVDDLYAVSVAMPLDWHSPDGTHFTEEGYRALAEAVAKALEPYLD